MVVKRNEMMVKWFGLFFLIHRVIGIGLRMLSVCIMNSWKPLHERIRFEGRTLLSSFGFFPLLSLEIGRFG